LRHNSLTLHVNKLPDGIFRIRYLPADDPLLRPPCYPGSTPITLRLVRSSELTKEELITCYRLLEETSAADYRASRNGWHPGRKKKEMTDKDQWYVLVSKADDDSERDRNMDAAGNEAHDDISSEGSIAAEVSSEGTISATDLHEGTLAATSSPPVSRATPARRTMASSAVLSRMPTTSPVQADPITSPVSVPARHHLPLGFLSFRLIRDDESPGLEPVLYIYEIHLSAPLRNQGLGSHLLRIADTVAARTEMEKVMLTVFTRNKAARRLYERCGFRIDESSPASRIFRNRIVEADYAILFKPVTGEEKEEE
jgi:ribosomal protein S18 acetylase RimI-like enzyme